MPENFGENPAVERNMQKNKKEKNKEFDIPIKVFGKKEKYEDDKEIVPVMIFGRKEKEEPNKDEEGTNKSTEGKKGGLKLAKMNKEFKFEWFEKKNHEERIKIMWFAVCSFMIIIVSVWVVFLKYNILLENVSLKQMERDEEWAKVKDDFSASMENFKKAIADVKVGEEENKENAGQKAQIELKDEDIEKLKKKIMERAE